jgi:hypothetical protein
MDKIRNKSRYEEKIAKNTFDGKRRQNGGSLRTVDRMKYEEKKMGKLGAASRVRKIEITDQERKRYESLCRN